MNRATRRYLKFMFLWVFAAMVFLIMQRTIRPRYQTELTRAQLQFTEDKASAIQKVEQKDLYEYYDSNEDEISEHKKKLEMSNLKMSENEPAQSYEYYNDDGEKIREKDTVNKDKIRQEKSKMEPIETYEYDDELNINEKDTINKATIKNKNSNTGLYEHDKNGENAEVKEVKGSTSCKEKLQVYESHFKHTLNISEITTGKAFNNEFEIIAFTRFTLTALYLVDHGMGNRVVERPIGLKKKELHEVIDFAISHLNQKQVSKDYQYDTDDFVEGIYRTEPAQGTHYELYFRNIHAKDKIKNPKRVIITRPFSPLTVVTDDTVENKKETVHIILPLSGRIDTFKGFMIRLSILLKKDSHITLTVIYFGQNGLSTVRKIIAKMQSKHKFLDIKLLTTNREFSRGVGLQMGVHKMTGDGLLFLCDVDVAFSLKFLKHCRLNSQKGQKVYYPIVFSLFNPNIVYKLQNQTIPPENKQLKISSKTGIWRMFGFGMTCQYKSDFINIGAFGDEVKGWGMEDVFLYRKYIKSDIMVVRATDPGIFHIWHEKTCDLKLPLQQYQGCLRSKALNEGSLTQLAPLIFKKEHEAYHKTKT